MGRGDIKTKKGKTFAGSFGKVRPAKVAKVNTPKKVVPAKAEVVVTEVKEKKVATKKAK